MHTLLDCCDFVSLFPNDNYLKWIKSDNGTCLATNIQIIVHTKNSAFKYICKQQGFILNWTSMHANSHKITFCCMRQCYTLIQRCSFLSEKKQSFQMFIHEKIKCQSGLEVQPWIRYCTYILVLYVVCYFLDIFWWVSYIQYTVQYTLPA